jgi:hypothetical protein
MLYARDVLVLIKLVKISREQVIATAIAIGFKIKKINMIGFY